MRRLSAACHLKNFEGCRANATALWLGSGDGRERTVLFVVMLRVASEGA